MLNAVGRDIPEEILKATGKEVFQRVHHFDGHVYKKHGPVTVIESVKEAMQYVLRIQGRRTVYCLGSLYLTGMIKEIIQESLSGCGEV